MSFILELLDRDISNPIPDASKNMGEEDDGETQLAKFNDLFSEFLGQLHGLNNIVLVLIILPGESKDI